MNPEGTLVHDRYRLVRQAGRGGMGDVFEAIDTRLQCTVAVKRSLERGELQDKAFVHEAKLLAGLRHAALPVVIDYFIEGDGQFLVMQFIPGDDLASGLRRGERVPLEDVLRWLTTLFDALEYLHAHEPPIVHRDIKPANLKLTSRGEIVLLDFGLAKGGAPADETMSRSVPGYTPRYSPPEQIEGRATDPRSDLYALGATLFHLLTAVPPPNATQRLAAVANHERDPICNPHVMNPDVPDAVGDVILRAMALDPTDRFASAREMRNALGAATAAFSHDAAAVGRAPGATMPAERTVPSSREEPPRPRRVDAAVPAGGEVARPIDLLVQFRFCDSPRLGLEDWPQRHRPEQIEQASEPVRLKFPTDPATGRYLPARALVKVVAPDFVVEGQAERVVEVPPDEYSKRVAFLVTPIRSGVCRINVEVYGEDAVYLGAIPVQTEVGGDLVAQPPLCVANLLLQVLSSGRLRVVPAGPLPTLAQPPQSPVSATSVLPSSRTPAAAPAASAASRMSRWSRVFAPAAAVLLVATLGIAYFAAGPGARPEPAGQSAAATPHPTTAAPAAPSEARPRADEAATSAAPAAAPNSPGLQRVALGGAVTSANDPAVTLTVVDLQPRGERTRIHLVLQNRSSRPTSVVFDYKSSLLRENSGRVLRIVADSSGAAPAGRVVIAVLPGEPSRCWFEVPSIAAGTSALSFSLSAPATAPNAPTFRPFGVRLAGSPKSSRKTGR